MNEENNSLEELNEVLEDDFEFTYDFELDVECELKDDFKDVFVDEITSMAGRLKVAAKHLWECAYNHTTEEERKDLLAQLTEIRSYVDELYSAVESLEV